MITIKEIAERANVSRTTVSRVLNNSGYVSEEAKKRVLEAIEETGYIPSEYAKSLRTKKTKVIGVILPKISTETSSRLVNGIDSVLAMEGYQILLANTNLDRKKEIESLKLLKSRHVDGIIFSATNINDELVEEIKKLNTPFVTVGQEIPGVSTVVFNDYEAAKDAATVLISRGHQKIAFIGVDEADRSVGYLRKKGYLDAMREHQLPVKDEWVQKGTFDVQSGFQAMARIITRSKDAPTAVVAVTDRLAVGAMQCLKQGGYSIPNDISLFGMGASEMSEFVTPPLSTVGFNNKKAGQEAAALILNKINGKEKEKKIITIDYRLFVRESVR